MISSASNLSLVVAEQEAFDGSLAARATKTIVPNNKHARNDHDDALAAKATNQPSHRSSTPLTTRRSTSTHNTCRIRTRYLSSLGIVPSSQQDSNLGSRIPKKLRLTRDSIKKSCHELDSHQDEASPIPVAATTTKALSSSCDSCETSTTAASSCSYSSTTTSSSIRKRVSFDSSPPQVHFVPHRLSYSPYRRQKIWIAPQELADNAARNTVEFRSEQWDYRLALEEDQFVTTPWTGAQRVHPATVWYWMSLRHQQQQATAHYNFPHEPKHFSKSKQASAVPPPDSPPPTMKQHFCRVMSAQQRS